MVSVFLVTSGRYSDYTVVAVFSTREAAEAYLPGVPDGNSSIAEFELDPATPPVLREGQYVYRVDMRLNGDVIQVFDCHEPAGAYVNWDWLSVHVTDVGIRDFVIASSEEHAVKIVNERRLQYLATGNYPKERT
jgi:hypothetical protein